MSQTFRSGVGTATAATASDAPDVLFDRLHGYERQLFRALLWSRVAVVAALAAILPDERRVHGHLFPAIVAVWVALAIWTVAAVPFADRLFALLRARPALVALDAAAFVAAMALGGGWRNPFYLVFWSVAGLVSIFWGARATLAAVAGGWAVQVATYVEGRTLIADPAAAHRLALSQWPSPLLGYAVIGLAFWYVRCRFDDLSRLARAYRDQAAAALAAGRSASVAQERSAIAFRLHDRVRQAFPAMRLRLSTMPAGDPDLTALAGLVDRADAELDAIFAELRRP